MRAAAIYARVSSDRQKEEHTIASQTAALMAFAREQHCDVPAEWVFEDEGYSGASLVRPGLERVRDLAAEGRIEAVLVHAPDRLSRRYAHQIFLIEEFARVGVRDPVRPIAACDDSGGSVVAPVPGHDRGIRAGSDSRALTPRQATSRPARTGQRAQRSAIRLSLRAQDRSISRLLRGRRKPGWHRPHGLRALHRTGPEHRRHYAPSQRAADSHLQRARPLGAIDTVGHAAQSRLQGCRLFRQDGDRAAPAHYPAHSASRRRRASQQR